MNSNERFLYQHRILKLSENKLEQWNRNEEVDKLIFAAENGMFNIRLKCIEFLSGRIAEHDVKNLLTSMISDDVEAVSEATMKVLEQSATSELLELIKRTRKHWKIKRKKRPANSYITNVQFGDTGKARPSERLMSRLRDQQRTNQPPYGF
ncbi:hypothetical protein [Roseivirga echinicomitans]|uniref:Uncharacterized protein n=1 Tax=Roseivirga echinicomitans TaxID=296218 RepID=A0A150X2G5_9BACT|nr:hypothetical protein [Roseivirga echinicomitans]KYG72906.1 hypothetical protein AWN68_09410 [Roseivirga echinicomitans]